MSWMHDSMAQARAETNRINDQLFADRNRPDAPYETMKIGASTAPVKMDPACPHCKAAGKWVEFPSEARLARHIAAEHS
jgi:hypothetical protein